MHPALCLCMCCAGPQMPSVGMFCCMLPDTAGSSVAPLPNAWYLLPSMDRLLVPRI